MYTIQRNFAFNRIYLLFVNNKFAIIYHKLEKVTAPLRTIKDFCLTTRVLNYDFNYKRRSCKFRRKLPFYCAVLETQKHTHIQNSRLDLFPEIKLSSRVAECKSLAGEISATFSRKSRRFRGQSNAKIKSGVSVTKQGTVFSLSFVKGFFRNYLFRKSWFRENFVLGIHYNKLLMFKAK